ncbi:MAG: hypothetical protein FWF73_04190 [Spirochaetes bacterium]|nr:hypothetical protein [Spirochaetota bacterium]
MGEFIFFKDEKYKFLLKYFTEDKIHSRFKSLWDDTVTVIKNLKLEDSVYIDEESFQMFILDYFADIARLKDFQDIKHVNADKIYGYELYWFLRRHPVHLIKNMPKGFNINEKIALGIFFPRILKEAGYEYKKVLKNQDHHKKIIVFTNLLRYNFEYRTYTQQSLELMIEAFFCGCAIAGK